jgi:D-3-phosphoglycerate dehydrogenase / 2-oxoglutarate reductase
VPETRARVVLVSEIARLGREQLAALEGTFELVDRHDLDNTRDPRVLAGGLARAWAVVAGSELYDAATLDLLPGLRLIARCGVGYDAIDVEAASARGVPVTITADANADGVADLALALILASLRRLALGDRGVRRGAWRPDGLAGDLTDATVGVVGLGRIGRKVVERLVGFGCTILAVEPYPDQDFCRAHAVAVVPLDRLLPAVDVLTLHVPLTDATRALVGARELALMKPSAVLVNTSRGGVVDESALVDALERGRLAGAGLDVFAAEPLPPRHPLVSQRNVILSPHVASFSRGTVERMLAAVTASLLDAAAGRVPAGCINLDALRAAPASRDAPPG